ncbi:hypothetical protein GIB67_036146 [Kingdonia uniflora]|uniref:FAD-binding domain-containing protein n=1 Tax=Kingdonia uniflora TaxID=39325 RepID=A0A7J7N973_9MAGN|nr:hypothetical protein GIB67_036146 [Kingdonia uniflora]
MLLSIRADGVRGLSVYPQGHGFDKKIQQFLNEGLRACIAPLSDTEIHWFLVSSSGPNGDNELKSGDPKLIQKNVLESSVDIPEVFLDVVQQSDLSKLTWTPLMIRVPWNLIFGKLSNGNITIAGDVMHPMTPDLAKGSCAALEEAVILGRHIGNSFHKHGELIPQEVLKA